MGIFFDWAEISKSKKGVRTSDGKACRVIVSSAGGEIFVVDDILISPDVHTSFSFDIIMKKLIFSIKH